MAFSKISTFATTLAGVALALSTACGIGGGGKVVGSGPLISNDRMLTTFNEIEVEGAINVTIQQGTSQRVNVSAQLDVQPLLKTEIKGEKLVISLRGNVDPNVNTNVAIVVAELESISSEGSGTIRAEGLSGGKLDIDVDGSGDVNLRNIKYSEVKVTQAGSGDVMLTGEGDKLQLTLDGSGDFAAGDFATEDVTLKTKGSGEVRVFADDNLEIELSGSGNVYYRGDPKLKITDSGSGEARAEN